MNDKVEKEGKEPRSLPVSPLQPCSHCEGCSAFEQPVTDYCRVSFLHRVITEVLEVGHKLGSLLFHGRTYEWGPFLGLAEIINNVKEAKYQLVIQEDSQLHTHTHPSEEDITPQASITLVGNHVLEPLGIF